MKWLINMVYDLQKRLARLEGMFSRAVTGVTDPIGGAAPETTFIDDEGIDTMPLDGTPFPGCVIVMPPGCQICVANPTHDPQLLTGVGTPVMMTAIEPYLSLIAGGGILLFDPTAGTGGLVITSAGVNVIGTLLNNGNPV